MTIFLKQKEKDWQQKLAQGQPSSQKNKKKNKKTKKKDEEKQWNQLKYVAIGAVRVEIITAYFEVGIESMEFPNGLFKPMTVNRNSRDLQK